MGNPLLKKLLASVPGQFLTWLFSSVGHTIEMLEKAAYTTPDKNKQPWGRTIQQIVRRRCK